MADSVESKRKLVKQALLKEHITDQALNENDVSVAPEISPTESLLRGTAQGATLGYGDELVGGAYGAAEAVPQAYKGVKNLLGMSDEGYDQDAVTKAYTEARDTNREKNKLAQEANPKTYLAGNVAGGLVTAPILGEAAAGIKGAALLGGAAGLGSSNVDLTKDLDAGKALQVAEDVGTGAALGGGIAAIPAAAGAAGKWAAGTTPGKAFLRGVEGEHIDPSTFAKTTGEETINYSKDTLKKLQDLEEAGAKVKSRMMKENKTPIDISKARETVEKGINEVSPSGTNVASLNDIKGKALEDVSGAFGDETKGILEKVRNNKPITAQEGEQLNTVLEALKGRSDYKDIKPITSALGKGQSQISQEINKIPEIGVMNKNLQDINAARNSIGAGSEFGENAINFNMEDPRQYKLSDAIYKAAGESGAGAKTNDQLRQMVSKLREVDPLMADKIESELPKLVENAEIASAINPSPNYSRAGLVKQALTKGANPLGRWVGQPAKAVSDVIGAGGVLPSAFEKAGVTASVRGGMGKSDTDMANTTKYTQMLSKMSPDQLQNVAMRLRNQTGMEGVAKKVEQAAQTGNPMDKAQAEFVIQQNPNAKKVLETPNE